MRIPMFPLGTVLVPFAHLPLHVFEPRYLALARDCLAGDQEFGVVLIERGSEVGGGDVRFSIGTVARITQASLLPDGRFLLDTVGTRRVRVDAWLGDDPYP
ncbi:MAG: LON peptidase substrate-binding domain-containing protein, partial [Acidimicrobiia bacterium]